MILVQIFHETARVYRSEQTEQAEVEDKKGSPRIRIETMLDRKPFDPISKQRKLW